MTYRESLKGFSQVFTCSDLRSCQVYGSKNLANIEGVEHESVVEFGGGGVKYGRWSVVSPVRPAVRNYYMHGILLIFGHLES